MFRRLTMTIFRLYMKYLISSYTRFIICSIYGWWEVTWARDLVCVWCCSVLCLCQYSYQIMCVEIICAHMPIQIHVQRAKRWFLWGIRAGVRSLPEISYENVTRRLLQKWGERIFSSQQLDRRVSIRIVMIMGLDYLTSPHPKIWWLRARCSLTGTFINRLGPPLMVRLTTRLTTYW